MINLIDISKSFDNEKTFAVKNLTINICEGETLVLLGSSGCGKTTTLKMINRLIELTSGTILIDDKNIMEYDPVELRRTIGYVFQGIGLFPHMTVEENTAIVLRLLGRPAGERRSRARELLELVGLEPDVYADRFPRHLSGGQQQRVGVARALAADPSYLLMDEPFGALDAITRDALQKEIITLKEKIQKTIIFVTHDIFEALTLADKLAIMHEGRLEQLGTKEDILNNPASDFIKELFSKHTEKLKEFNGCF